MIIALAVGSLGVMALFGAMLCFFGAATVKMLEGPVGTIAMWVLTALCLGVCFVVATS